MAKKLNIILCAGANGRAVIVGTVARKPIVGEPVEVRDARMVLRWDSACGGLLGLAANGPKADTRLTAPVPRVVETVWQEWVELTPDAKAAIDRWASWRS